MAGLAGPRADGLLPYVVITTTLTDSDRRIEWAPSLAAALDRYGHSLARTSVSIRRALDVDLVTSALGGPDA